MSYDYLLFKRPQDGSAPSLETIAEDPAPIGSIEEVRASISTLFPKTRWESPHGEVEAWFGLGGPEFQVSAQAGFVMNFMASHIEPEEVLKLVKEMQLVALDLQSEEIIGA